LARGSIRNPLRLRFDAASGAASPNQSMTSRSETERWVLGNPNAASVTPHIAELTTYETVPSTSLARPTVSANAESRIGVFSRTTVRATLIEAEIFPRKSGVRLCTGCGKAKPLEEFSYRDRARGLRRARCRSCVREYSREHYRQNKLRYATADWGRMRCSRQH